MVRYFNRARLLLHYCTKIGTSPLFFIRLISNFYRESIDKFSSKVRLSIFDKWFRGEMVHMQNDSEIIYRKHKARFY